MRVDMLMTCDLAARATCCSCRLLATCSSCMLFWHFTSMEIKLLTSIVKRNKTAQNTLYYTATRMNKNIYIYIHMNSYNNNSNSEQQQELTESIKNNEKHKYRLYDCNVTSFKIEQNMQNNIKTKTQQQQQESNSNHNKHEQTTHVQHGAHI